MDGKLLCVEHDEVKPDLVVLGKALSGGTYSVSAVLGRGGCIRSDPTWGAWVNIRRKSDSVLGGNGCAGRT